MPCDYSKYPPNWKTEIVPRIRARSGDRCEWCDVINHSWVVRHPALDCVVYVTGPEDLIDGITPTLITLTTAHLGAPLIRFDMDETKRCSHCKAIKPFEEFSFDPKMSSGRTSWCKECCRARNKRWYANGGNAVSIAATRSWRARNPDRVRQQHRDWVCNNRERRREQMRLAWADWKRRNPGIVAMHSAVNKSRSRGTNTPGIFTQIQWMDLCKAYDGRCACCRTGFNLTPDHIVPLALGGCNHIENIQPLCLSCNLKKGTQVIYYKAKHDKHDVRDENLAHLCQGCHLGYDLPDHIRHRRENRDLALGILRMDLP